MITIKFKFCNNVTKNHLLFNNNLGDLKNLCSINIKDNIYLSFYYNLNNYKKYNISNRNTFIVKLEELNSTTTKLYLLEDEKYVLNFLDEDINKEHIISAELTLLKYDLSKSPFIPNYIFEKIKQNIEQYMLLLEYRSNKYVEFGDYGTIFFYIKKEDYLNNNFKNVVAIRESF